MLAAANFRGSDRLKLRIVIDGKMYEVDYENAEAVDSSSSSTNAVDQAQSLILATPHSSASNTAADESKIFRTPMAGIVTKINVEAGQLVASGDVLLVVEAMKMENNLAAATGGKIASVKVKIGDPVKAGQILIELI